MFFWVGIASMWCYVCEIISPEIVFFWGETALKVKVPSARIENSLLPLYSGTDFSTLAETFKKDIVWGDYKLLWRVTCL